MIKHRENGFLSDKKIKELKEVLLSEKERILNQKISNERYCLSKDELSDPLDEANVNIQTSQALRFRNRENFYLKKINKSLELIAVESYGLCADCDSEISFERLLARPTADMCIGCKEEAEFGEKNNIHHKKSKSLGKTISEIGRKA